MAAPKGNTFWKNATATGRKAYFKTPAALWSQAVAYFKWVEDNPLLEDKLFKVGDEVLHEPMAKMRAMTIGGMCIFMDITPRTFQKYYEKPEFKHTIDMIREIIREQKFTAAASGLLDSTIVSRDLGLIDKKELSGNDGGPITVNINDLGDEELLKIASGIQTTSGD